MMKIEKYLINKKLLEFDFTYTFKFQGNRKKIQKYPPPPRHPSPLSPLTLLRENFSCRTSQSLSYIIALIQKFFFQKYRKILPPFPPDNLRRWLSVNSLGIHYTIMLPQKISIKSRDKQLQSVPLLHVFPHIMTRAYFI